MGFNNIDEIEELVKAFSELPEVLAITLGGSRTSGYCDKDSDYDVYVYSEEPVPASKRKAILMKYCQYTEFENTFWEEEDDCILNSGTVIEIIYRNCNAIIEQLESTVINGNANNGYTTCMWSNVMSSIILYEKDEMYSNLKERFDIPFPAILKKNIIRKNYQLLTGYIPSFDSQIRKAYKRNDMVSVNHRITEYLASYFDLIFAANEMLHPGEKRMLTIALERCEYLPKNMEDISNLLKNMFDEEKMTYYLKQLEENMTKFIIKYSLLP
ncbi:nucleotidyltransferase domain-containing protein [Anaerosporobacter sp.]|uniref:nucleotidyltransferase domain-containing protein n=1 Tax=Anaerosporobacter sp. TaxID=1872529 RepID=UPI00286ECEF2|nr:nucleotidyltransferase domain-containing protein [Anaerosporobacter sp.]